MEYSPRPSPSPDLNPIKLAFLLQMKAESATNPGWSIGLNYFRALKQGLLFKSVCITKVMKFFCFYYIHWIKFECLHFNQRQTAWVQMIKQNNSLKIFMVIVWPAIYLNRWTDRLMPFCSEALEGSALPYFTWAHHLHRNEKFTTGIVEQSRQMLQLHTYLPIKNRIQIENHAFIQFTVGALCFLTPSFCHFTIYVCNLIRRAVWQVLCFSLHLAPFPPGPLSAPRPLQPRLNGWAALWKTVLILKTSLAQLKALSPRLSS